MGEPIFPAWSLCWPLPAASMPFQSDCDPPGTQGQVGAEAGCGAEGGAVMLRMSRLQSQRGVGLPAKATRPKAGMKGWGVQLPALGPEAQMGQVWAGVALELELGRLGSENAVGLEAARTSSEPALCFCTLFDAG